MKNKLIHKMELEKAKELVEKYGYKIVGFRMMKGATEIYITAELIADLSALKELLKDEAFLDG